MKTATRRHLLQFAIVVCIASAEGYLGAEPDPLKECRSASSTELSDIRGGYVAGNGLEVSFGIDKMLAVNGVLLANDTLSFMLSAAANQGTATGVSGSMAGKVQNGANNSIDLSVLSGLRPDSFTFIQNTLDRAVIQNTTTIDVSVTVRNLYRDLNLSSMMNRQLIDSLR